MMYHKLYIQSTLSLRQKQSLNDTMVGTHQTHSSALTRSTARSDGSSYSLHGSTWQRTRTDVDASATDTLTSNEGEEHTSNLLLSAISYATKSLSEQVLRYGETIDSLFCITESSSRSSHRHHHRTRRPKKRSGRRTLRQQRRRLPRQRSWTQTWSMYLSNYYLMSHVSHHVLYI